MKLEVTKWVVDFLLGASKQCSEFLLRCLLFLLPLGVYLMLLEFRSKVSSTSNLTNYTKDESIWQHVFPGFILVAINPNLFKNDIKRINNNFQEWIKQNKYTLISLFFFLIILLMLLKH